MSSVISEVNASGGNLVVSHQISVNTQIEMAETDYHLIGCLLKGLHKRKVSRIGDQEHIGEVRQGDLCIKPASHSGFWSWEAPDDSLVFYIQPNFLRQIAAANNFLNPDRVELLPILSRNDAHLNHLVSLFHQEVDNPQFGGQMYLESLSNMLGIHLLRHYCAFPVREPDYQGGLPAYKLQKIIDYISAHLEEDISLGELAEEVGLSQSHFSTLFRHSTGKSPYKFLTRQRIDRAQRLLLETDMSIAEIADSVGFCDQSHLSRHMKRILGVSPRKLRQQSA